MPITEMSQITELADLLAAGGVCVLSGAGLSTESGIPDYRGATGRARPATPMTFSEFVNNPAARQRYWARSHAGWSRIRQAQPNAGHRAVASFEAAGMVGAIITQNVDGLHQRAGAQQVLELHGGLDRVVCLECAATSARAELDARLTAANPYLPSRAVTEAVKPDGDVDLSEADAASFVMVNCLDCGGGMLKPDVVFFGEFLPPGRVELAFSRLDSCRTLLVLGSSLTVASGYRFVRRAETLGMPVAIVNQGPTRGDKHAAVRVDAALGDVLTALGSVI